MKRPHINSMVIKEFYCSGCGNIFPLPKSNIYKRRSGHIKHIFCVYCGKIMPHIERQ